MTASGDVYLHGNCAPNPSRHLLGPISIKKTDLGILDNVKLRFENEPARHKLLDLIGDLSLLGKQIKGKIHATKLGHKNNIKFAKYLQNTIKTKNGL